MGKEWTVKETWGDGNGYTEHKAKVEGFEKIKVEAGEFEAFKVTLKGFWNLTANGNGSGRAERVIWYAPQIKREVKRAYTDRNQGGSLWNQNEQELVKWKPKAELGKSPVVEKNQAINQQLRSQLQTHLQSKAIASGLTQQRQRLPKHFSKHCWAENRQQQQLKIDRNLWMSYFARNWL